MAGGTHYSGFMVGDFEVRYGRYSGSKMEDESCGLWSEVALRASWGLGVMWKAAGRGLELEGRLRQGVRTESGSE